ncbi:MAG TPA: winged helix-turn-helix domain-containing protein [Bryobacteraceae bacterium]|nr:winged helix-turn-helix domain-containing protein [Bryobacteraceae bacterium]
MSGFSDTAALLSDPARAAMLLTLMDGRSLPAGQLAMIAGIAPQTASSHLAKLVSGRLLALERQGRHRYYCLASIHVAHAIESVLAITPRPDVPSLLKPPRSADGLDFARTCYSHLAGRLAVEIADALKRKRLIVTDGPKRYKLTKSGRDWIENFGIVISPSQAARSRFAYPCLDWTERRHHIAGDLGAALLKRLAELRWIAPLRDSRAVRVTVTGQEQLARLLDIKTLSR